MKRKFPWLALALSVAAPVFPQAAFAAESGPKQYMTLDPRYACVFAGMSAYSTYEMFEDRNQALAWTNIGLLGVGLSTSMLIPYEAGYPHLGGYLLLGSVGISSLYPLGALIGGYLDKDGGKVERGWVGYGCLCLWGAVGMVMMHGPGEDRRQEDRVEFEPVLSPDYSGLRLSKVF